MLRGERSRLGPRYDGRSRARLPHNGRCTSLASSCFSFPPLLPTHSRCGFGRDQRANQLNQRAETYHPSSSPAALTTYGSEKLPLADARALLSLIEPDSAGRVTCGGFGKPRRRL